MRGLPTSSTTSDRPRDPNSIFTCVELTRKLEAVIGKTLEEVDSFNVFEKFSKNKGIAGHVIEKSVLGYNLNNDPNPDIEVDGVAVEVKTTGMRKVKGKFVAKEPVSITGVFIDKIVKEMEFEQSHLWKKARQLLFVYYFYDYNGSYNVQEYRRFIIEGYEMKIISDEDKVILESDWTAVRDFIKDNPKSRYPELSHLQLMYMDTAPKYLEVDGKVKQSPRFRFKRAYVNGFIQERFYGQTQVPLPFVFDKYTQFDDRCAQLTSRYRGMTVFDLLHHFQIYTKSIHKAISERIILKMFDSDAQKINDIGIFNKLGLVGKSLVQSVNNGRTEDMKLFKIDFDEIRNPDLEFEDSQFYTYFKDNQMLTILFQEQTKKNVKFEENKFIGFKRISFDEEFIQNEVRPVWEEIRRLVNNNELVEVFEYDKDGNIRLTPKTKVPISAPNFPKSEDYLVFVRGSGVDKSKLPLEINGIKMLTQYLWIRGRELNEVMNGDRTF